jgi:hypothetical protein
MLIRRDRAALNIISADSILGIVPNSSSRNSTRFGSLPPNSSATDSISRYSCWTISDTRKKTPGFSSGSTRNTADLRLVNVSASILVSKHKIISSSESRNVLSLDMAVDNTLAIACTEELSAAPANQRVLWSLGNLSISAWNRLLSLTGDGASRSCISLNAETMCRFRGGENSAIIRNTEVRSPSAAS